MRKFTAIAALSVTALLGATSLLYAQGAMRSTWSGVYTTAQADKGKALVEENCAKCHGGTLDGNDEIPALKGSHFMADWETQSVAELIERVHSTMPMDNPGKLNVESATNVVSYLLQQNGMPAGATPLTDGTARQARIESNRPAGMPAATAPVTATPIATKPVAAAKATVTASAKPVTKPVAKPAAMAKPKPKAPAN